MFVMLDILPDMLYLSCLVCCIFVCLVRYFVFVFILPGILWAPSNGWSAVQILSCPKGFLYLEGVSLVFVFCDKPICLDQGPKQNLIVNQMSNDNMVMTLIILPMTMMMMMLPSSATEAKIWICRCGDRIGSPRNNKNISSVLPPWAH